MNLLLGMACGDDSQRKCFTFIWKLENASYCWQSHSKFIDSPTFTVDEIHETNWSLRLYPCNERNDYIEFYLKRQKDSKGVENVDIDCELAFLSSEATVLHSFEKKNCKIGKNGYIGNEFLFQTGSVCLPQDNTLTARCRMWKSAGEMSKESQCFARTRIAVEKRSFLWKIEKFSTLKPYGKKIYEIKSHDNEKSFMILELFLTGGIICDETIRFKVIPNHLNIKLSTFQLSIVDASKNAVKCFQDEFWCEDPCASKDFILFCNKRKLLEKKTEYLPNDVLSLWCECVFSLANVQEEIEKIESDCIAVVKTKLDNRSVEKEFCFSKCILLGNLKSMLNDSSLSDIKLKTKSQTYTAHKSILGAQSPVFKAMFSSDMKEKIKECVDIEDLNDDTLLRMLHYIYSAEIKELDWASATNLYEAADKYQILNLKDVCSSYLKSNLGLGNACEALVLADLHQDEDLKGVVQDFILRGGKDIINSEEWEQLMKTNVNLAAETMRLKLKELL